MAAAGVLGADRLRIDCVPQDDLVDVFKHFDLATKCRLRRVSRYWRDLVGLKEVNEVVIVDFRCMYVSNPRATSQSSGRHTCEWDGTPYSEAFRLHCGWWYWLNHPDVVSQKHTFVRLSDHQRHGLLGNHVRALIYNGLWDPKSYSVCQVIWSIGMYCINMQHLVFWQCGRHTRQRLEFFMVSNFQAPAFHGDRVGRRMVGSVWPLRLITVVASTMTLANLYDEGPLTNARLTAVVAGACQSREELYRELVQCTPAERVWVAEMAPLLPQQYHAQMQDGVELCRFWNEGQTCIIWMNLVDGDYSQLDDVVVRLLAFLVERDGLCPAPESFNRFKWILYDKDA